MLNSTDMVDLSVIYNKYLITAGGGERSTLEYAVALAQNSKDVYIVTDGIGDVNIEMLALQFSIILPDNIKFLQFKTESELKNYLSKSYIDVFCNHTWNSTLPNYGRIGIYSVMFPTTDIYADKDCVENLSMYDFFLTNSEFTKIYTLKNWEKCLKNSTVEVLIPPISDIHIKSNNNFKDKEKLILNVGRFNVNGHNKCQFEAIDSFIRLVKEGVLDDSWRFELCGKLNDISDTVAYVNKCKEISKNYNINISLNVPFAELYEKYQKASVFWQFTGYGIQYGKNPEKCEHLGLVALDALAHGTIPIIFCRSGASFIIDNGFDGFVFSDYFELRQIMDLFKKVYKSEIHNNFFNNAIDKSKLFSFENFQRNLWDFINRGLNECRTSTRKYY